MFFLGGFAGDQDVSSLVGLVLSPRHHFDGVSPRLVLKLLEVLFGKATISLRSLSVIRRVVFGTTTFLWRLGLLRRLGLLSFDSRLLHLPTFEIVLGEQLVQDDLVRFPVFQISVRLRQKPIQLHPLKDIVIVHVVVVRVVLHGLIRVVAPVPGILVISLDFFFNRS